MIRPIIFCKAPVPGRVKTRLQTILTPEQAAAVHAAMAARVIGQVMRLYPQVWIAADDPTHPFFRSFDASVLRQGQGDLGERMQRLAHRAFMQGAGGVLLLGTDSPLMSDARLQYAAGYLRRYDVVIGPVQDGGYDCMAIGGMYESLFRDIPWSTPAVLSVTLARIATAGLDHRLLSTGFDVDRPEDLERAVRAGLRLPPGCLPHPHLIDGKQDLDHDQDDDIPLHA